MRKSVLYSLALLLFVSSFYVLKEDKKMEVAQSDEGHVAGVQSVRYDIEGQEVTPEYFGRPATGDIDGDGTHDEAAIVITDASGGTGTFYYIVATLNTSDGKKGTNGIFLGDRIVPQSTEIIDGKVVVNYADRNQDEPMTNPPTVGITKYFVIDGENLVPLVVLE